MRTILQDVDRVLASPPYQLWASTHKIDSGKVKAERQGTRRPQSSDSYARTLIVAIRAGHIEAGTKPPAPTPPPLVKLPAPFDGNGLFLLEPTGGTEDIAAAKAAGFTYLLLNLAHASGGNWDTHRQRAAQLGLAVVPWRRVLAPTDSQDIEVTADLWGSPATAHNLETEAMTTYPPANLAGVCSSFRVRPRAVITEPWMQNGAGWSALRTWVAIPETFQNANPAYTPDALTWHAHQEGMPMAVPAFGWGVWSDAPNYVNPSTYLAEWPGPFAVYMGDSKEAQYGEWRR